MIVLNFFVVVRKVLLNSFGGKRIKYDLGSGALHAYLLLPVDLAD